MNESELIRKYYDELVKAAMELYKTHPNFQIDLYLYPDGTIDTFENYGGNNWLNNDHIVVLKINHEHLSMDDEEREAEAEGYWDSEIREYIERMIDDRIEQLVQEEKYKEEWHYEN